MAASNGFSIVIPVYNEEELIEKNTKRLIKFLDENKCKEYEIILADNGSADKTKELGAKLSKIDIIKFISVAEKGPGLAFKDAILNAKYNKIISADMDLSVELKFILKAVKLLGEYDIVVGSKITGEQKRSFFRKFPC